MQQYGEKIMKLNRIVLIAIAVSFLAVFAVNAQNTDENVKVKINDTVFDVELENNAATHELVKTLKKGNVTVNATDYGNFEKVGDLGFSLPTSDEQVTTAPGDIVLYHGNQVSLFYESHSWSYTKLGKIQNVAGLGEVLGSGDVTIEFILD